MTEFEKHIEDMPTDELIARLKQYGVEVVDHNSKNKGGIKITDFSEDMI